MRRWFRQTAKSAVLGLSRHSLVRKALLFEIPRKRGAVALTFDDGPHPTYTLDVLDLLRHHSLRATFFVLGSEIEKCPQVLEQIVRDGHDIGIHSYYHTNEQSPKQIRQMETLLGEFGVSTTLWRPPHGKLDLSTLLWTILNGYKTVMWSFDCRDSLCHEGKEASTPRMEAVKAGDIVLLHDDNPVCLSDLERIIEMIKAKGLGALPLSCVQLATGMTR